MKNRSGAFLFLSSIFLNFQNSFTIRLGELFAFTGKVQILFYAILSF